MTRKLGKSREDHKPLPATTHLATAVGPRVRPGVCPSVLQCRTPSLSFEKYFLTLEETACPPTSIGRRQAGTWQDSCVSGDDYEFEDLYLDALLKLADHDWPPVFHIWWGANGMFPHKSLSERLSLSERVIRRLLDEGTR